MCRNGMRKSRRVVLAHTNMQVLRQLAKSASSTQQHLQSLLGALDAQHEEAHRTAEASAAASRQALEFTYQSIQASQAMMQKIQTRQEAEMKALQEDFQIQAVCKKPWFANQYLLKMQSKPPKPRRKKFNGTSRSTPDVLSHPHGFSSIKDLYRSSMLASSAMGKAQASVERIVS